MTGARLPSPAHLSIPTSDGASLAALRYAAGDGPSPSVVMFTPYRRQSPLVLPYVEIARQVGCDFVIVDVRGLGDSEGDWDGPLSPREITDGAEVLEWLADQPFCDGRTAMVGPSYCGAIQYLIAARRPRGLTCIAPSVAPVDFYRDLWHRGGLPSMAFWGALTAQMSQHRPGTMNRVTADFYGPTLGDPLDGPRPRGRSGEPVLGEIATPALVVGGWYDYFTRATLRAFERLTAPKRLLVGNWSHEPELPAVEGEELHRWLAFWLRGDGEDPTAAPNVRVQTIRDDAWTEHDGWPRAGDVDWREWQPLEAPHTVAVATTFEDVPPTTESHLGLVYDLAVDSGMRVWGEAWHAQTSLGETETRLRGPVALRLVLAVDEPTDVDAHARLSIVGADGHVHQVTEGRLRASHRALDPARSGLTPSGDVAVPWHPHDRPSLLDPAEPTALEIEINPVNLAIGAAERIRIGVTLVRSHEGTTPTEATLLPATRVLLPVLR